MSKRHREFSPEVQSNPRRRRLLPNTEIDLAEIGPNALSDEAPKQAFPAVYSEVKTLRDRANVAEFVLEFTAPLFEAEFYNRWSTPLPPLKALALVSRRLARRAQPFLFRRLRPIETDLLWDHPLVRGLKSGTWQYGPCVRYELSLKL